MSAWAWRALTVASLLLLVSLFVGFAAETRTGFTGRFPATFLAYARTTFGMLALCVAAGSLLAAAFYALCRGEGGGS